MAQQIAPSQEFQDTGAMLQFLQNAIVRLTKPWVMVFDNFDHPQGYQHIHMLLPPSGRGVVLFTSRHGAAAELGVTIKVSGMTDNEGLQLLSGQSVGHIDQNTGKQILKVLGHLPLAIDQARAYIQARQLSFQDFLKHYKQRRKQILQSTPWFSRYQRDMEDGQGLKALSVFTTWEMSLGQLNSSQGQQSLEDFLTLSAHFDPTHIGEEMFRIYVGKVDTIPPYLRDFVLEGR
jgi:hypothetical protein